MPKKIDDFLAEPVPFEEAAQLIADKPAMTRELFDDLLPELKASAFVISKVEDLDVVRAVRDRISESPFLNTEDDPEAAERRAELLLRAHGFAAYSAANWRSLEENKDIFPWRKYQTAQDDRVRGSHAALDGLILPADSPFWIDHTPPWEFGCRCDVVGMMDEEVQELLEEDRKKTPSEKSIYEPNSAELNALEQRGRIIRRAKTESGGYGDQEINVERDPNGFGYRPQDVCLLRDVDLLRSRLGADLFEAFREWAQGTEISELGSVWDWVTGERTTVPASRRAGVGLPDPPRKRKKASMPAISSGKTRVGDKEFSDPADAESYAAKLARERKERYQKDLRKFGKEKVDRWIAEMDRESRPDGGESIPKPTTTDAQEIAAAQLENLGYLTRAQKAIRWAQEKGRI